MRSNARLVVNSAAPTFRCGTARQCRHVRLQAFVVSQKTSRSEGLIGGPALTGCGGRSWRRGVVDMFFTRGNGSTTREQAVFSRHLAGSAGFPASPLSVRLTRSKSAVLTPY